MSADLIDRGVLPAISVIDEEGKLIAEGFMASLRNGLKKKYGRKRDGVHISDLEMCQRQIVFRDLNPDIELTNTDLNNFTSGSAIGAALESAAAEDKKYRTEAFTSLGHFINGHIDIYDKVNNIPVEFKTYRSGNSSKLPKLHQLGQLKSYMTGTGATYGLLLYQLLMKFEDEETFKVSIQNGFLLLEFGPWALFVVKMTPEDRAEWNALKIGQGLQLAKARAYGQPALASHVMNNKDLNWLCRKCPFKKPCKEINEGAELQ